MTIPNLLTILRVLLTPLLVIFLLEEKLSAALAVFIVAGITDGLDGLIARLYMQKTRLGAFLDPLADKLLGYHLRALGRKAPGTQLAYCNCIESRRTHPPGHFCLIYAKSAC